jgi:anti-anti-sigma factor
MPFKVNIRQIGRIAILDIEGPVRLGVAEEQFRERTQELLKAGTLLLAINLGHVTDVDSSGVGLFVRTWSQFKRLGGTCVFFAASERVRSVFRMVGLEYTLDLFADETAALARF